MDHRAFSEIRDMLDQGLSIKESREQVNQNFRSVTNASDFFPNVAKIAPAHDYSHELLLRTLATLLPRSPSVIDLGAGTGRLSKLVVERFPECQVTLVDVSDKLLEEAERQLERIGARFKIVAGDLFETDIDLEVESFDGVISSFALCHGRLESDYEGLYRRILEWIKPSGCFLCLDHVHGAKTDLTMLGYEDWAELLSETFPEDRVEKIMKNSIIEDSPLSLSRHLFLLSKVGFKNVDVLWKEGLFALYGAVGKSKKNRL